MVPIKQKLVSKAVRQRVTYGGLNGKRFITIHTTGNTSRGANAEMHARLQSNGNSRDASWHWQVDDKVAIQSFPHTSQCWHAGDGRGDGNLNSIGIEICINSDGNYKKAVGNAAALVRKIMRDEGISIMNVKRHYDWSGKYCPRQIMDGRDGITWSKFLNMLKGEPVKVEGTKTEKEGLLKVQTGAFSNPEKAEKQLEQVKKAGFEDAFISGKKPAEKEKKPAKIAEDGYWGPATTRRLQEYFRTPVDGVISGQPDNKSVRNIPSAQVGNGGSLLIRKMQEFAGTSVDGQISDPSQLIRALQKRFGTTIDGHVSSPSLMVREMQRRLNRNKL